MVGHAHSYQGYAQPLRAPWPCSGPGTPYQPLPQQHHSRAGLQLPTLLSCPDMGPAKLLLVPMEPQTLW